MGPIECGGPAPLVATAGLEVTELVPGVPGVPQAARVLPAPAQPCIQPTTRALHEAGQSPGPSEAVLQPGPPAQLEPPAPHRGGEVPAHQLRVGDGAGAGGAGHHRPSSPSSGCSPGTEPRVLSTEAKPSYPAPVPQLSAVVQPYLEQQGRSPVVQSASILPGSHQFCGDTGEEVVAQGWLDSPWCWRSLGTSAFSLLRRTAWYCSTVVMVSTVERLCQSQSNSSSPSLHCTTWTR